MPGTSTCSNLCIVRPELGEIIVVKFVHFPCLFICNLYDVGESPSPTDLFQALNSSSIQVSLTNEMVGGTWSDGKTGTDGSVLSLFINYSCFLDKTHAIYCYILNVICMQWM